MKINIAEKFEKLKKIKTRKIYFPSLWMDSNYPNLENDFTILNDYFKEEIDDIKKELENGDIDFALKKLIKLRDKNLDKASDENKFRIITNIGVIYSKVDDLQEASKCFIEAFQYNKNSEIAISNLSVAFLYTDYFDETAFQLIQYKNPNKALAIKINRELKNKTFEEISNQIPINELNNIDVLSVLVNHFYKIKDWVNAITFSQKIYLIDNNMYDKN